MIHDKFCDEDELVSLTCLCELFTKIRADEREKAAQHLYRWDSLQPRPVNDGDDSLWSEMFRAYDLGASNVLADIRELLKEQSIKLIQTYVDGEQE